MKGFKMQVTLDKKQQEQNKKIFEKFLSDKNKSDFFIKTKTCFFEVFLGKEGFDIELNSLLNFTKKDLIESYEYFMSYDEILTTYYCKFNNEVKIKEFPIYTNLNLISCDLGIVRNCIHLDIDIHYINIYKDVNNRYFINCYDIMSEDLFKRAFNL